MHDIDYKDIFTLIIKFNTFRIFITLTIIKDLKCYQIDVNNAFIEFFLKEKIYISSFVNITITFNHIFRIL